MTSRPLFMSVAESMVIFPPMAHVGCASASSTVTPARSSRRRPRNGPPEAVIVMRSSAPGGMARRRWCSAVCSESIGSSRAPVASASWVTSSPPTTSDSLLASARSMPSPSAAIVGPRPADPTRALRTRSASDSMTSRTSPSGPASTSPSVHASAARAAASGSARAMRRTPSSRARATSGSHARPADRPTTSRSSVRATTSSAWVPMDPVAPRRSRRRAMAAYCRSARLAGMSRKQGALVAAILGSTVVTVDATVVNVALPRIAEDLGGGLAGQQWVANAYLLTLASLILVAGSLSDIFGERRIFVAGVAGFGIFSLACALAPTVGVLVVARGLQGVAGALLTPAALAIIVAVFPQDERGAAIGSWTAWGGVGVLIGPLLGGQIVDHVSWRWVFGLNVPIVLATLAIASRYVPEGRRSGGRPRPKVDVRGATLCATGLGLISFALIERRWWVLVPGLALFTAFIIVEARAAEPM